MRARYAAAIVVAGSLSAAPAAACSVARGYQVPSGLEMAAGADTIVIATVTGARPESETSPPAVVTRPTTLLKGRTLPAEVVLRFAYLEHPPATATVTRSDQRELREANPDAMRGGCFRYTFVAGMQLVLFLRREATGKLVPYRPAFAREAEDVAGPDALWVKAVREYVAIGALPRARWRERLASRAAELRARGDVDSRAIAADMDVERTAPRSR